MKRIGLLIFTAFLLLGFSPAQSPVKSPVHSPALDNRAPVVVVEGEEEESASYLDSVVASTVFDLDATIAASYPGTGTTWANLTATPADGSAQTAYDFYTGDGVTSTLYPTFTGSPGDQAAYWAFDGGDAFSLKSGVNPTFLAQLPHSSAATGNHWMAVVVQIVNGTSQGFGGNGGSGSGSVGISFRTQTNEELEYTQRYGSTNNSYDTNTAVPTGQYNLVIVSYNKTTGTVAWAVNSATLSTASFALGSNSTDAGAVFAIGAVRWTGAAFTNVLASGGRIVSFAMGNEYLDDTKAGLIISHLEARHSRDYTP